MSQEERGTEGGNAEAKKYVVFCVDGRKYGQPGYAFFTHEADVMMIAAAGEVERGKLTPSGARELLEPYREVLPPLYTDSQRMVFDPARFDWNDPESFPTAEAVVASPQASQIFWYEVDELGIDGVTLVWSTPFPVLAPVRNKALEELKEAVSDEYEIVVKDTLDEFDAMGKSVEWARKLIADAAATEPPQQSRLFSDTDRSSGADRVRQALNDPAFDAGRYIDDEIRNLRDGDLVRICLLEDESQEIMAGDIGEVLYSIGDTYDVDVGGIEAEFPRGAIELMPTGFNPHYGDKQ